MNSHPPGFLAVPSTGTGRGVLVLHAWWGLNAAMRTVCTRLAEAGLLAFAPDLYHGQIATTIAEAERLSNALDQSQARAELADAVDFLSRRAERGNEGLAVIGFSLGAFFALDLSVSDPGPIRAVVLFYGTRPGDYSSARAAYCGHFAESDEFEPESEVERLQKALASAGRPASFYRYPGTGHWFFEPDRTDAYNPAAAALAWERTLAFLGHSLVLPDLPS
jgi:carboxymethylenebutenolidase